MQDRTDEIARRLDVDPRVLALVVGAPWRRASGVDSEPAGAAGSAAVDPAGERPVHGRVFVGVPSPSELRELDLPADGLRHFGLTPADLRAGGWTDADLRSAGIPVPGAEGTGRDGVEWFVAGEPAQLMLGLRPHGAPRLARAEPRWDGHIPGVEPVDVEDLPGLAGCTDPEAPAALAVRELRDGLLRRARRRLVHCPVCLRQVHRSNTTHGACHGCAGRWLGIVY
ncbi:hypothetical protein WIS52_26145 [Pseudonocardia nematodicida]|uniref:Uncharacterized protein n=1 Tax=Pseudonocardia nematodicida TaxID=1206997 RepID=A0ABV1KJ57_9PSEU